MSKNDARFQKIQVDGITNANAAVQFIEVGKVMRYTSGAFDTSDPQALVMRRDLEGAYVSVAKSKIPTPGGQLDVDWQNDIDPFTGLTYAVKHGNMIGSVMAYYGEPGSKTKYDANFSFTEDEDENILIVTFVDTFPGFLILI